MTIQELIRNKDYHGIISLPDHQYDMYKVVAYIHLERYSDALFLIKQLLALHDRKTVNVDSNSIGMNRLSISDTSANVDGDKPAVSDTSASMNRPSTSDMSAKYHSDLLFYKAYVLYKLKRYGRCIRTLQGRTAGDRERTLLSQAYYYLGYYGKAYDMLVNVKYEKERDVNLCAMISLSKISFQKDGDSTIGNVCVDTLRPANLRAQLAYNDSFKDYKFYNTGMYIQKYRDSTNRYIREQVSNLQGRVSQTLTDRQRRVAEYNRDNGTGMRKCMIHRSIDVFRGVVRMGRTARSNDEMLMCYLRYLRGESVDEDIVRDVLGLVSK